MTEKPAYKELEQRLKELQKQSADQKEIIESLKQKCRESEHRYRELVRNANSAIIRWSRDGTITYFNEYAQGFFGYSAEEAIGQSVDIIVPRTESTGRSLSGLVQDILSHPEKYENNLNENVCRDGRRAWMLWTNKAFVDDKGQVKEILAVGSDITRQKKAQDTLSESEQWLKLTQSAAGFGTFDWDFTTDRAKCSPMYFQIFGIDPGDGFVTREQWLQRIHPGDRGRVVEDLNPIMDEDSSYSSEYRIIRPDGSVRFVHTTGQLIRNSHGRPQRMIGALRDITREKRSERAVVDNERIYRAIAANLPNGAAFVVDHDLRYLLAEGGAIRTAGLRPEDFEGKTIFEALDKEIAASYEPNFRKALEGEPFGIEHESHGRHYLTRGVPLTDDQGSVHAALAVSHDITERKHLEEAKEQRIHDLDALIDIGSQVLASESMQEMLDRVVDGARILTCAKIGTSGHGYREGHFRVGATSRSKDSPSCPPGSVFVVGRGGVYMDLIEESDCIRLTHEELLSHPLWWGLPEAHTPLKGLLGARLTNGAGEAKGLIMVSQKEQGDFTTEDELILKQLASMASIGLQHLEAREALQEARDLLELRVRERSRELTERNEILEKILDNIPVMVTFYGPSGFVEYINPEAERKIGLSLDQVQRVDLMEYCYPDPEYRQEVWRFMKNVEGWKDIRMHVGDGENLESSWANVRLSDGSYIGIGIDVTERRQAEEKINQYIEQLEWMNRELQEFASVASHDLQEPLRKIRMFGDRLLEKFSTELNDAARDYLIRMTKAADRMQSLIKALLSYSRVSTKTNPFERVDLKHLVQRIVDDLVLFTDQPEPVVEIGDMPAVEADPVQMSQLFQNLIGNALRYSKKGQTPVVSVSGRELPPKKGSRTPRCEVRVKDSGTGFDMRHLDKIFRPFERLHRGRDYPGTGMGLAICRKIVERHGGSITARSSPQQGATFIVILPKNQSS